MGCGGSAAKAPETEKTDEKPEKKDAKPFDTPVPQKGAKPRAATEEGKKRKGWRGQHTDLKQEEVAVVRSTWVAARKKAVKDGGKSIGVRVFEELENQYSAGDIIHSVLKNGETVGGVFGDRFEDKFSQFIEILHDVAVSNAEQGNTDNLTRYDELVAPIVKLARTHAGYGVVEYHYTCMWKVVLYFVRTTFTANLTAEERNENFGPDVKQAWRSFFSYLGRIVVTEHRKTLAQNDPGTGVTPPPKKSPTSDAVGRLHPQHPPRRIGVLPTQVRPLMESLAALHIKDAGPPPEVEAAYYAQLFKKAPHLRAVFESDSQEGYSQCRFFECLRDVVDELPNCSEATLIELSELGVRHSLYGVKPRDYHTACTALTRVMTTVHPGSFAEGAWVSLFHSLKMVLSLQPVRRGSKASYGSDEFPDPDEIRRTIASSGGYVCVCVWCPVRMCTH